MQLFWKAAMPPQARTLWFRVLNRKLPTRTELYRIGQAPNPICSLCNSRRDSVAHFIVYCPSKWSLWVEILTCVFPSIYISSSDLFKMLCLQQVPSQITDRSKLFTVLAIGQWQIWKAYWNLVIKQVAFEPFNIISTTITQ
ncbi:hypothetical protein G6F37_013043 [Rhizopus arrhizus]|nr:hypothetical protein G6F37_013043 [Rhizopus arrhizus]